MTCCTSLIATRALPMSTFKGILAEFPQIRIDYFRQHPDHKPPLACFLSHVHSDHLAGLESLRAPFVYCSAATREVSQLCPCTICNIDRRPIDAPTQASLGGGHAVAFTCQLQLYSAIAGQPISSVQLLNWNHGLVHPRIVGSAKSDDIE